MSGELELWNVISRSRWEVFAHSCQANRCNVSERCSSRQGLFWLGRFQRSESFHLLQKVAAVDYVVELDRGLAAAEIGDELFEGVGRILRMDADSAQVSGISEAREEFEKRVSSFEG